MARTLPRTPRSSRRRVSQTLAVLCTLALASGPALLPGARADELDDKKNKIEQQVENAEESLEDSSRALYNATTKLRSARTQLGVAQRRLARTIGELTAARVLDAQMQAKLNRAVAALAVAEEELATGKENVIEQRAAIGRTAAANYQFGDPRLLGLSMVLNSQDPTELAVQLDTIDNVMNRQTAMFDELRATEALLEVTREKVEAAKVAVAEQRQAAAVNLARKKKLEAAAVADRAKVLALVEARRKLTVVAARARAADARKLRQMKKEEERIKKLILERANQNKGNGFSGDAGGFLRRPVDGEITSPFGYRRHPIYGYWGLHNGTDFRAPCGTPELAGARGTVISEYYSDVWGNRLILDVGRVNGKSMTLIYNHISSYRVGTGARVGRGDTVAYSGSTGWSTGCHLHFTVMLNGTAVNPENYF